MSPGKYVVLVPVKPPVVGKSRLGDLPDGQRRRLAEAFARDTVEAALATPSVDEVLVVTDDHRLAASLASTGCEVLPDGVAGDLNASLVQAALEGRRRWPHLRPVALCADLPALRAEDLGSALDAVPAGPAFVPDEAGTGTTLYTADHDHFAPRFGVGSRDAHLADGAVELSGATRLRRDVDDVGDLQHVLELGVGNHTARATGRN